MRGALLVIGLGLLGCRTTTPVEKALAEHPEALQVRQLLRPEVQLLCEPADAEVVLDGVPQGACEDYDGQPQGLALDEQAHRLEVRKRGFTSYRAELMAGQARTILRVRLAPAG